MKPIAVVLDAVWASTQDWLAISVFEKETSIGSVSFCDHKGSNKSDGASRSGQINLISWHPTQSLVCVSWTDGYTALVPRGGPIGNVIVDKGPVRFLEWSRDGKVLMVLLETNQVQLYTFNVSKSGSITTKMLRESKLEETIVQVSQRLIFGNEAPKEDGTRRMSWSSKLAKSKGSQFLLGSDSGNLYGIDANEQIMVHKVDSGIIFLDYSEVKRTVVLFSKSLYLYHLREQNDILTEAVKVRIAGEVKDFKFYLSDPIFIVSYQSKEIRMWDLLNEENGIVTLDTSKGYDANDSITCLTVDSLKGIISAGTTSGKVASWRKRKLENSSIDTSWRLQTSNQVGKEITKLIWSPTKSSLVVLSDSEIIFLDDGSQLVQMKGKVAAVLTSQTTFTLLNVASTVTQPLRLTIKAKGICLGDKQLAVWDDDTIMVYDVQSSLATIQSTSFTCSTSDIVLASQSLYCIEKEKINIRTIQGTIRQIISFPEIEGDPILMHLNKNYLAVGTTKGFVRIYNVSKRDPQQEHNAKCLFEAIDDFHTLISVKINVAGNKVACTYYEDPQTIADKVIVYDAENDAITYFSFDKGMTDMQEYEAQAELAHTTQGRPVTAAARKMVKEQSRFQMMYHRPGELEWDENDNRFLVIECNHIQPESNDQRTLTTFVTAENGILLQDLQQKSSQCGRLLYSSVPNLYFLKKTEWEDENVRGERTVGKVIVAKQLREFSGIDDCNDDVRKTLMDFCFYLTLGSMDSAFKTIQNIKSERVWEQMASMSVKTRRLDVAVICLGHMKNVRGARAIRSSQKAGENESMQCAALALELGMIDEAMSIYSTNERWDLVNKLLQSQNMWPQAFEIANTKDRIHLRNTHFNYARYMEEFGDPTSMETAFDNYEKAGVHLQELPRMFANNPKMMENYVRRKPQPGLFKWWGAYLESLGSMDGAINFYTHAQDTLAIVKAKCSQGKIDEAAKIALESNEKAACFTIGRLYEAEGDAVQAVQFYTKARALSSAIRLAKEHDMKDNIANLSLMAGGNDVVEAARYYEDLPGYADKAVMLYHKAGMIGRALDLAFRTEQFSALDLIVKDLDASTDPQILKRAAEFFEANQNYEKSLELMCFAKDFESAVNLCRTRNIRVTDKLADQMTPDSVSMPNADQRKRVLAGIAEVCLHQGAYSAATKKYTQAGDKLSAMKALLKSGDVKKIRFFANTARDKNIYILAGNFLQTTEWHTDPGIIKDIESFYTKAQSFEHLASFYKACATIEAENWADLGNAVAALYRSLDMLGLAAEKEAKPYYDDLRQEMNKNIDQLKKLIRIMEDLQKDNADGMRQLAKLAEECDEEDLIQSSKIYTTMIVEYVTKKNWKEAYRTLTALRKKAPALDLESHIETAMLDQICDEMKVERVTKKKDEANSDHEDEVDFSHAMKRVQR